MRWFGLYGVPYPYSPVQNKRLCFCSCPDATVKAQPSGTVLQTPASVLWLASPRAGTRTAGFASSRAKCSGAGPDAWLELWTLAKEESESR
uniref:Uncharacterized protein n=1 Tax=Knipowitschia caucasica TaxID=637954 RepID=A0AAV2L8N1_KNICA